MNADQFALWWATLWEALKPGTELAHWSAENEYQLGGSFVVVSINEHCVQIQKPRRTISWQDFFDVLQISGDYSKGVVSRKSLESKTKHSTYVISTIRWLEKQPK
jgi:hypothetical protein